MAKKQTGGYDPAADAKQRVADLVAGGVPKKDAIKAVAEGMRHQDVVMFSEDGKTQLDPAYLTPPL